MSGGIFGRYLLRLLGPAQILAPDGRDATPKGRKATCLLAYLAMLPSGSASREQLAGLLWSDRPEEQARASLRQCLGELRRSFPSDPDTFLSMDRNRVSLGFDRLDADTRQIEGLIGRSDLECAGQCATLWRGDLLAGMPGVDPAFDEWLFLERERLRNRVAQRLIHAAAQARSSGDPLLQRLVDTVLRIDPAAEEVYRLLMVDAAARGDRPAALRVYDRLRTYLARELRTRPGPETERLVEDIREGRIAPVAAAPGSPPPANPTEPARAPTLLVLPFANLSGDPALEPIGAGFADDLTTALTRFRELRVMSRPVGSVTPPDTVDLALLKQRHGVDYVLQGSLRPFASELLRINVQLSEARTQQQIWSSRYEVATDELGVLFDDVIKQILGAILPALEADLTQHIRQKSGAERRAYDFFLQAKHLLYVAPRPGQGQQIAELLERAVELDPNFALPYFHLVRLLNTDLCFTEIGGPSAPRRARAYALAKRGLELDGQNAQAHVAMGFCHLRAGEWLAASYHFERVLALNPFDPHRLTDVATGLMFLGDTEQALTHMLEAFRRNPAHSEYYFADLAEIRLVRGELAAAWELFQQAHLEVPYRLGWRAACAGRLNLRNAAAMLAQSFVRGVRAAWVGEPSAGQREFVRWFHDTLPFRRPEDRAAIFTGLQAAGLDCGLLPRDVVADGADRV